MELKLATEPRSAYTFANKFNSVPEKKDYAKMSEEELLAELRGTRDFDKFVFPNEWYSKHELPVKECMNTKEFIKESPWLKSHQHNYIGQSWMEAKPGGNRPVLPAPETPTLSVIENNFSDKDETTNQTASSGQPETQQS
jgi:hypothetical protein